MRIAALYLALGLCLADSASWQVQFQHGLELLRDRKYVAARQCFEQVTELNPHYSQGFFYLGMSALHAGDRPAAEAALQRAVKLEPAAQSALYNLGLLRLEDKNPKEAAAYLERARQAGPLSPELAINLTRAYLERGQKERAVSTMETGAAQFADLTEFHVLSGKLLLDYGMAMPACAALARADRLEPRQSEIALPMAAACVAGNDLAAARAALTSIEANSQGDVEFHSISAKLHLAAGEKEAAVREMESGVRLQPDNPLLLLELGRFDQKLGEQQKALEIFEKPALFARTYRIYRTAWQ